MIIFGIPVGVIASVVMPVKLINIQILKIVHAKKRLIGKIVLTCEDEISKTTETSIYD